MPKVSFADLHERLDQVRLGKVKEGLTYGQYDIDQYLRFKPGNFNVVIGHANVGKTSVILYLMLLQSVKNDLKWLIFSSENTSVSIVKKLSEYYLGKPMNNIDSDEFQIALDFVQRFFIIIDADKKMYTAKDLLEEATNIWNEDPFDGFLIDPYNSLTKDKEMYKSLGGHEYDYEISTEMRQWGKQKNVSIWLNAHAVTNALRIKHPNDHDYAGHPVPPAMGDIEGGCKWGNRADDVIVIHLYTQHPTEWMYNHIHVRKIKEVETGGRPTPIDEPIKMRSLPNNVGYEINGENLIVKKEKNQSNFPF